MENLHKKLHLKKNESTPFSKKNIFELKYKHLHLKQIRHIDIDVMFTPNS